jgi:hypothetical protein
MFRAVDRYLGTLADLAFSRQTRLAARDPDHPKLPQCPRFDRNSVYGESERGLTRLRVLFSDGLVDALCASSKGADARSVEKS